MQIAEPTSTLSRFRSIGLYSLVLYCLLAVFFGIVQASKAQFDVVVLATTGALAGLYFYGLRYVRNCPTSLILIFAIAFSLVGLFTIPFDSTDVFFYMATGWAQTHYQINPYSTSLRETTGADDDPMIHNRWMERSRNPWVDLPLAYGFLFAVVVRAIAWLGHGHFWTTLVLFKLLNLLTHAGTAALLWKSSRFLPDVNPKTVLYLYAWNPFVVLEYLANVHNDILVGFLIALAVYALLSGRLFWTIPALAAAGLVKYVTFILVPFAFIFLGRQQGWVKAIRSVLLACALVVFCGLPYFGQIGAFKYGLIATQLSESTGSLHAFLFYSYRAVVRLWPSLAGSLPTFSALTGIALWFIVSAFIVLEFYASRSDKFLKTETTILRWFLILFAIIFIASSKFWAWYIGMLFPLALLTRRKTILADAVIFMSCTHMLSFASLRTKTLGYVLFATIIPIVWTAIASSMTKRVADI